MENAKKNTLTEALKIEAVDILSKWNDAKIVFFEALHLEAVKLYMYVKGKKLAFGRTSDESL